MNVASLVNRTCPRLYQVLRRLNAARRYFLNGAELALDLPRGHYYSPLPDVGAARHFAENAARLDAATTEMPGIDLRRDAQRSLVLELLALIREFSWTDCDGPDRRFHLRPANQNFLWSDAIFLQAMLRHQRPRHVIEIGGGFTSALMLDTDDQFLDNQTRFTFIEPYPMLLQQRLRESDLARVTIHARPVQEVSLEVFEMLEAGGVLFIDSSHVSKTGSDVNFLLFEVLSRLKSGVLVHWHDIFWPFEYPGEWLLPGRAFNEAYALRAFLQFNHAFEIILWVPFVNKLMDNELLAAQPLLQRNTGASIWLRRV